MNALDERASRLRELDEDLRAIESEIDALTFERLLDGAIAMGNVDSEERGAWMRRYTMADVGPIVLSDEVLRAALLDHMRGLTEEQA